MKLVSVCWKGMREGRREREEETVNRLAESLASMDEEGGDAQCPLAAGKDKAGRPQHDGVAGTADLRTRLGNAARGGWGVGVAGMGCGRRVDAKADFWEV
jgi:hypothetical protein